MRIFITGAAGFVGRAVVPLLLRQGHCVEALVRGRTLQRMPYRRRLSLIEGDLREPGDWQRRARVADAIIHLAAGELGTMNVIEAAMQSNRVPPRFICLSHLGSNAAAEPALLHQAAAKEEVVRHSGIDHLIFRSAPIYGPGDRLATPWMRWFRFSPLAPLTASAAQVRLQPIALRNVAEGVAKAATRRSFAQRQEYDIAGPRMYTLYEFLQALGAISRRRKVRCWTVSETWYRRWSNFFAGSACFPYAAHLLDAWNQAEPCNPVAFFKDFCIRPVYLESNLPADAQARSRATVKHMT